MANTQTYTVVKDGEVLKELKTLAAAKKLADTEGAEVICEGQTVYTAAVAFAPAIETEEEQMVKAEKPTEPVKYKLLSKMNVRTAPSLDAPKLGIAQAGTVVDVSAIEDDWLHLTNGAYILYGGGKFAREG